MNTRSSTRDAGEQTVYAYQSEYFSMPASEATNDASILRKIDAALTTHNKKLKKLKNTDKKKAAIALDLVNFSRTLSPNLCLNILIEASRHSLFTNTSAHQIIANAINRETLYRSPVIVSEHTLVNVLRLKDTNPVEQENFLKNPELLLIWLNDAASLETSRLLNHFYQQDTRYYLQLRDIAKKEIESGEPRKGILCTALMNSERPASDDISHINKAITWLTENEPASGYERIIKSLQIRINPCMASINQASGCYVNADNLELSAEKITAHDLRGASLRGASLDYLSFTDIDLTGAHMDGASLSGAEFNGSNLTDAFFNHANLSFCVIINTNLNYTNFSSANFSYADLSRANLRNAIFDNAIFDGTEFVVRKKFYDPLAFEAELDRLHNMVTGHRNETRLRDAIIRDIIQFTRKPEVDSATADSLLKAARAHPFSQQHKPMQLLKTGANFVANYAQAAYQNLFFKTELPKPPFIETNEELLLRLECEKREAEIATELFNAADIPALKPN